MGMRTPSALAYNGAVTAVPGSVTDVELVPADGSRLGWSVFNNTGQAAYIRYGSVAATTAAFTVRLADGGSWVDPWNYVGPVRYIGASSAAGNMLVTVAK